MGKLDRLTELQAELRRQADPATAAILQRFFKTAPGQYGAGDVFLGLRVPVSRHIALEYADLGLVDLKKLLRSKIHEFRLTALMIMVRQYQKPANTNSQAQIIKFYLANARYINNWDLVDLSVYNILGDYLTRLNTPARRLILDRLAASGNLWQRRMAMVSTYAFIKKGETQETFRLAKKLLDDKHDLMHKAVGWMLREAGKRVSVSELKAFLEKNRRLMPRTALRYAIEHFPPEERRRFLL